MLFLFRQEVEKADGRLVGREEEEEKATLFVSVSVTAPLSAQ